MWSFLCSILKKIEIERMENDMLDIKLFRNDPEFLKDKVAKRGMDTKVVDGVVSPDDKRRQLIRKAEEMKAERNKMSGEIAEKKRNKENADDVIAEMRTIGSYIKLLYNDLNNMDKDREDILSSIPN